MRIKQSTAGHRRRFNIAAQHLRDDRNELFLTYGRAMIGRLRAGGGEALREIAMELREGGIYSSAIPLCSAEVMVMKKLFRLFGDGSRWQDFVQNSVGAMWLSGIREVRYVHIKYVRR